MSSALCEAFAREFFTFFEAEWQPRGPHRASVVLPPLLAAQFGSGQLNLVFVGEPAEEEVLVAPGSRLFESMVGFLAGRGRHAAFSLLPQVWPAPEFTGVGGELEPLPDAPADRHYWIYDFLLAFVTDERVEHLFSVAFDESGAIAPDALIWLGEAALADSDDLAAPLHPAHRLAEAEHWARREAEKRAQEPEKTAAERLALTTTRLEAYFRELIEEVPVRPRRGQSFEEALEAASEEQRRLEAELARRLSDEARRHQLRVSIKPLGYATLRVPGRQWRWRISVQGVHRELRAWQDLATGALDGPQCQRCAQAVSQWTACRRAHLICVDCSAQCAECGDICCRQELESCAVCGVGRCAKCMLRCVSGHAVCREHRVVCACCGQGVCTACGVTVGEAPDTPVWWIAGHAES